MNASRGIVEYKERGPIVFLMSPKIFHLRMVVVPVRKLDHEFRKTSIALKCNLSSDEFLRTISMMPSSRSPWFCYKVRNPFYNNENVALSTDNVIL